MVLLLRWSYCSSRLIVGYGLFVGVVLLFWSSHCCEAFELSWSYCRGGFIVVVFFIVNGGFFNKVVFCIYVTNVKNEQMNIVYRVFLSFLGKASAEETAGQLGEGKLSDGRMERWMDE